MTPFVYEVASSRVVFGPGRLSEAGAELDRLGVRRALVLSTPEQVEDAERLAEALGERSAGVFAQAAMHTPTSVTARALEYVTQIGADGTAAIGGGSTIGLGKAIALHTDLPQLAIPTTYAGSEMTPILGQTEDGTKTTQRSAAVLPETVIYDPELTYSLPARIAGPSGMNALAHAVEALYAENRNPIVSMQAEAAVAALGRALPVIASGGEAEEARAEALYGAWLAGACLGAVGMALHHKVCHTLGGSFDLNHAVVHAVMLPYTARYNAEAAAEPMARVARALCVEDAPGGLYDLMVKTGETRSLRDLGLSEADIDRAAALAVRNPYYNPRPVTQEGVRAMLAAAWRGQRP